MRMAMPCQQVAGQTGDVRTRSCSSFTDFRLALTQPGCHVCCNGLLLAGQTLTSEANELLVRDVIMVGDGAGEYEYRYRAGGRIAATLCGLLVYSGSKVGGSTSSSVSAGLGF